MLKFVASEVDETKKNAAVEHEAELERQKQVCGESQILFYN